MHLIVFAASKKCHLPSSLLRRLSGHFGTFSFDWYQHPCSQELSLVPVHHAFFHTQFLYTRMLVTVMNALHRRTISHSEQDKSVNQTCFLVRPQHLATQPGSSRQHGGQIRKDSRLKRQLRRCHYACLPSKSPYPLPRRQKQCLLFYLATGV